MYNLDKKENLECIEFHDKNMFLITSQPKINYVGNELSLNNVHM